VAIAWIHEIPGVDIVEAIAEVEPAADPAGTIGFETGTRAVAVRNEVTPVVIGIELPGQVELSEVAEASDFLGLGFSSGERGEQQRSEYGDDGDYNQELDQREG
jgi:hypothetical protein